jgi:hypothetical protein
MGPSVPDVDVGNDLNPWPFFGARARKVSHTADKSFQLSASMITHELRERVHIELLKHVAELLAVGAMWGKAAVELPENAECHVAVLQAYLAKSVAEKFRGHVIRPKTPSLQLIVRVSSEFPRFATAIVAPTAAKIVPSKAIELYYPAFAVGLRRVKSTMN